MEFITTPSSRQRQSIHEEVEEEQEEERDPYSSPTRSIQARHAQLQQRQRQRSIDHRYRDTPVDMAASFETRRLTSPRLEKHHSRINSSANPSSFTDSTSSKIFFSSHIMTPKEKVALPVRD